MADTSQLHHQAEPVGAWAQLDALLQVVEQPVFALGPAGEVTLWSEAAARAFGWSAEEVVGRPPPMIGPEQGPALGALRDRVGREGRLAGVEARWRRRDGTPVALRLTLAPVGEAGGGIVAAPGVGGPGAARVALDRYRALAKHARDIVLFVRPGDGRILEANDAAVTAYGYSYEELTGLSVADLRAPRTHGELAGQLAEALARSVLFETEHRRADGSTFPVEVSSTAATIDGERILLSIVRDISARRQADAERELLRAALAATANAVVITDTGGHVQWANPAFTTLTGYEAAEVLGRKTSFLRSGRHDVAFYKELWDTVLAGRSWRGELVNRRKDGALYVEEMTITPVLVEGQPAHFVAIKQEVTARVERAREREAMLTIAEAMRQARARADLLPILLEQTCVLLQAEAAALAICDPATGDSVFELGLGEWEELGRLRLPAGVSVTGRVIASGELYHSDDIRGDPALARPELMGGVRAAVCAPLRSEGVVIGALWAGRQAPMGPAERRLVAAIADLAANAIRRATLSEQTERQLRRLIGLRTIDHAITNSFDMRLSLSVVLDQTVQQLGVDAAAVLILNPHSLTLEHAASRGFHTNAILSTRVRLGEGLAGQAALEHKTMVVPAVADPESGFVRWGLIAAERFESYIAVPLVARGHVRGVLEVFHRAPLPGDAEWLDYLEALAGQTAVAVDNAELFEHMQRANIEMALAYDTTLEGWSRALELRDKETEGHSQRVTDLTVRLARAMEIGDDEIVHIRRGALLHDIGKVGIPDAILLKAGPLSPAEREVVKLHPTYAYELLRPIAYLRPALAIPYCHHEKWDGTGYPRGLKG
ncbi:MAG TPA: PAS domain S-box protein, partial [Chloroflexaceae bacterium]|nr:PAS domain S-box protein [Chloroflexaceae bacterium]